MLDFINKLAARSPWIYRINAGSCNGCDVEMATAALIPRYDVERLGCKYCGSPRHADVVLISGPLTMACPFGAIEVGVEGELSFTGRKNQGSAKKCDLCET